MEKNEVQKRVIAVVAKVLKMNDSEIAPDANFIFDLGADSMQSLELVAGFEEEFDIEISDEQAEKLVTVKDVFDFIDAQ